MKKSLLSRRAAIKTLGAYTTFAGLSPKVKAEVEAEKPPNIIYFFSDTHRWSALPFTQAKGLCTPNMESLKDQSLWMSHCFTNAPVCSPFRGILLSGRWPWQQGLVGNHMTLHSRLDVPRSRTKSSNLGGLFKAAGYETAYFGKSHWGGLDVRPFGFDKSFVADQNQHDRLRRCEDGSALPDWRRRLDVNNSRPIIQEAIQHLTQWSSQPEENRPPLCMLISINPPHGFMRDAPSRMKALYPDIGKLPFAWYDTRRDFLDHQGYHAHISATDEDLGLLLAAMNKIDIADDTIFVYTSDHGGMGGLHGMPYGSKHRPEDEATRVPFFIRWPGKISPGGVSDRLFSTIDHLPTLASLAGLDSLYKERPGYEANICRDYLSECPGLDFAQHFLDRNLKKGPDPEAIFIESNTPEHRSINRPPFRAVVTKDYTYSLKSGEQYVLYARNSEDPYRNILAQVSPAEIDYLYQMTLEQWLKYEAPYVEDWIYNTSRENIIAWTRAFGFRSRRRMEDRDLAYSLVFNPYL